MPIEQNIDDLPILEEVAGEGEDLPIENQVTTVKRSPSQIDDMKRGHAAILKADIDNTNVFDAFDQLPDDTDPDTLLNLLSYKRSETEKQLVKDHFNNPDNRGNTAEQVVDNLEVYDEMLLEVESAKYKPAKQIVDSIASIDIDADERSSIEAELMLVNTINDMVSDYTFFEKAIDFGKMLLPTTIIDNIQLTGAPFGAESYLRDVVIGMKEMQRSEPERFKEVFPKFVEVLKEQLPTGKQLSVLSAIVNPRGEEMVEGFSDLDVLLDIVDIASLGTYTAIKMGTLVNRLNAIKTAAKLNNKDLAADINTAAVLDDTGEVAKTVGVSDDTVYSNAAPFNVEDIDTSYAQGMSTEVLQRLQAVKQQQIKVSQILNSEKGLLREDILTPAERGIAETRFERELKVRGVENIRVADRKSTHTEFEYDVLDTEGNVVKTDKSKMFLQFSDKTEVWEKTEEGMLLNFVKSPTVWAKNALEDVQSAIRLDTTTAVTGKLLRDLHKQALEPLTRGIKGKIPGTVRSKMAAIDDVLLSGDQYKDASGVRGKVYTVDELRGGVAGKALDDDQIETYYNVRNLYDELWTIRNNESRRTLLAQGKREINITGTPYIGTSYDRRGATAIINRDGNVRVYNSEIDDVVDLDIDELNRLYDNGYVLNKVDEDIRPIEDAEDLYDLVITGSSKVKELPDKVLHYREGYVPKVNKDSYWFVKSHGTKVVNGRIRDNQILKTERFFSSRKEAEDWIKSTGRKDLQAYADRAVERQVLGSSGQGAGGGLYTGSRSSEDIPFGTEGLPVERLNSFEALNHYIQSLENFIGRNQWRLSMQQKWVNSVKAAGLDKDGRIAREGFNPDLLAETDARAAGLKRLGEQINIWSKFPTQGELLWDGFVSGSMEWALNRRFAPKKVVVKGANYIRNAGDPVTKLRSIAFHSLLGWFNPAQLWVQAQGAVNAAALATTFKDPLAAVRIYAQQTALAFSSRYVKDPGVMSHLAAKLTSIGGNLSAKDLTKITEMWHRTGLEDSILNTADHSAALKGFGTTAAAIRSAADKGTTFYRAGELFNRRFSFLTALERKKQKIGTYNLTDKQLKEVLTDANNMMFNLSKANAAKWQRGPLALPTQFLQVQAKFIEEILGPGKSFTPTERLKIGMANLAFFGAAGVPLGNFAVRYLTEALGFTQAEVEANPSMAKAVNGGFWDWYAYQIMGVDVDIASRGAIANGVLEFTTDLMFSEATVGEKLSGAFGIVPHRFFQGFSSVKPMMASLYHGADLTNEEVIMAISDMAAITSTWSNARKAFFMNRLDKMLDSRGRVIDEQDFDPKLEAMVLLGFQPTEQRRVRERTIMLQASKEYRAEVTDMLVDNYYDYVIAIQNSDSDEEKEQLISNYSLRTKLILKLLRNEDQVRKVMDSLNERISSSSTLKEQTIKNWIEEFSDGQTTEWGNIISSMRASGMLTNDMADIKQPIDGDEDEGNK